MTTNEVDIREDFLLQLGADVLQKLLIDHTTRQNIFWATDSYADRGEGYAYADQITVERITGANGCVVQPRAVKARDEQTRRTKGRAEVFTPSWVCNAQNNLVDDAWFGRPGVFNIEDADAHTWRATSRPVEFPEGKTWRDYVRDIRLEVACGEAPYLVSRYDTVTGEPIPLAERIGLLDRKLRVVSENTNTSGEWLDWAKLALMATYGFEWQGDNLLLAREAALMTFAEHYEAKFGKAPLPKSFAHAAYIISWNIFQMDGIKCVIPDSCHPTVTVGLFGEETITPCPGCKEGGHKGHTGIRVMVKDWGVKNKEEQKIYFTDLMRP